MLLSVIIPVYRVETTLNRCVESVVSQEHVDLEIILVEDGSPDSSPHICDEWAERDSRIKVIHQKNAGLGAARNAGIRKAEGNYLTFVDSDDFISPQTYAPLIMYLRDHPETDILEYPVIIHHKQEEPVERLEFPIEKLYTDMESYWYQGKAYQHTFAWNKIYRSELFEKVKFAEDTIFEDNYTLYELLNHVKTVKTMNRGLYHYQYNPNGITATADGDSLARLLQHHVDIIGKTARRDTDFQRYYMQVANLQIDVYEQTGRPPVLPTIKTSPHLFKGSARLKSAVINLLGIKTLCQAIKLTHPLWRNRSSVL